MFGFDWEDLDEFLIEGEFSSNALVLKDGSDETFRIIGCFDDPFLSAETGEYDLHTSRPRLTCKSTDAQNVERYDRMAIDGRYFDVVADPMHDGTGMAIIELAPN